jgi:Uma2 family endonuclease
LRDFLLELLRPIVRKQKLGVMTGEQEYDFDGEVHAPDVSFVGVAKLPLLNRRQRVQRFVLDFAVEVVSPSNTFDSLDHKKDRYRRCGALEEWLISRCDGLSTYTPKTAE